MIRLEAVKVKTVALAVVVRRVRAPPRPSSM
jgi:hypothetical protein